MTELAKLIESLMELRRYVASDPEHVRTGIKNIGMLTNPAVANSFLRDRLDGNLDAAKCFILAEPELARSYLYAAAAELRIEHERTR